MIKNIFIMILNVFKFKDSNNFNYNFKNKDQTLKISKSLVDNLVKKCISWLDNYLPIHCKHL